MNKKRGFTLIELLATILVIGIIALIITSVSLNLIFKAKKNHFRNEVLITFDTLEEYLTANGEDKFNTEGITVAELKTIKTNDFTNGVFKKTNHNTEEAYYVTDGVFCARGPKEKIIVEDSCHKLDDTPAIVDRNKIHLVSTENSISVTIDSGFAEDPESGISRIIIEVTGGGKTITKVVHEIGKHTIDKLKHNTEYDVKVKVVNGNELTETLDHSIKTDDIAIPYIELDTEDWSREKIATINYPDKAGYINEYSIDDGLTWNTYRGPITFTENGSLIARTSDSSRTNVVSSEAYTIDLIDRQNPTCGAWSGEATSSTDWAQTRTVGVACQDDGECVQDTYSETINSGVTTTQDLTFEIYDKAGNHTTCSKEGAMFYVDKTAPSCGSWSGENGSWKNGGTITVNVGCSDGSGSGCVQNSYQAYTVSSGNITTKAVSVNIYDKAGNSTPCSKTANIYLDTSTYTATFNANGGSGGGTRQSKFGVAYGSIPGAGSKTCYSFAGYSGSPSASTTMPRGGTTYTASWKASSGWSGSSYCNSGTKVKSAYVAENLDNTHYFWINSSGNKANANARYAWFKGSKGWWFHVQGDEAAYERSSSVNICKRNSNSTLSCTKYTFDSSGWCTNNNYAC